MQTEQTKGKVQINNEGCGTVVLLSRIHSFQRAGFLYRGIETGGRGGKRQRFSFPVNVQQLDEGGHASKMPPIRCVFHQP